VRYPVHVGRGEHWHGVPPDARDPEPVRLPPRDALGADDVYMPAGWFAAGGDPEAGDSVPATRLWCDAAVFKRFPVTNLEYLAFLNDLVAAGRDDEALAAVPREEGGTAGVAGAALYGRDGDGRFVLRADSQGDVWQLDWPVVMIDWSGAGAYCDWFAARTGQPWRLPAEFEREKASRGVDGRLYPWGDLGDPSWSCMHDSHRGKPLPAAIDTFPVDESVYGLRGMGGNVRDWCADRYVRELRPAPDSRVVPDLRPSIAPGEDPRRVYRGGSWVGSPRTIRCACRFGSLATGRLPFTGVRLARDA
jgi:eukaryotic-like serine/threonine-protein kinase